MWDQQRVCEEDDTFVGRGIFAAGSQWEFNIIEGLEVCKAVGDYFEDRQRERK